MMTNSVAQRKHRRVRSSAVASVTKREQITEHHPAALSEDEPKAKSELSRVGGDGCFATKGKIKTVHGQMLVPS